MDAADDNQPESMDIWETCPHMICMNKRKTHYLGLISTNNQNYRLDVRLPDDGHLSGSTLLCDHKLKLLLRGYESIIQQRLQRSSSLADFLKELKTIIEKRQDAETLHLAPPANVSSDLIKEIDAIGWNRLVSVDPHFQNICFKLMDDHDREHYLQIIVHSQHPRVSPSFRTNLPVTFTYHWTDQSSLKDIYAQFSRVVDSYQDFWTVMSELDKKTWVLDPEKPSFSSCYRRIAVDTNVSLQITVNSNHPRHLPEIRILGAEHAVKPLQQTMNTNLVLWDPELSLLSNLQQCLDVTFPSPTNTTKQDFSLECGICYSYRLLHEIPSKTCDHRKCGQSYHQSCLFEWLREVASSRQSLDTIFGECPYCSKPIAVKRPPCAGPVHM